MGRKSLALVIAAVPCFAVLGGCSVTSGRESHAAATGSHRRDLPSAVSSRDVGVAVQATLARWRLPAPVSREVVLPVSGGLELVGGLLGNGASSTAVRSVNPRTGRASMSGQLAIASHDAAGAVLAGRGYLFGGGDSATSAAVQRLGRQGLATVDATLPRPRSDLAAVTVGDAAYLVGGYDGNRLARSVLRSTDGTHFAAVASLPVPVRYPAVAARDGTIWVFGGQSATGLTSVIQRIDIASGRSRVVGRLPSRLSSAAVLSMDGSFYVCGGTTPTGPTAAIVRFDDRTGRVQAAGRLPLPLSNSASAVIGGTGYLLGGETPTTTSAVVLLHLVPRTNPAGTS